MPTGYTAVIQDNLDISMKDFALVCARAFGACVMMRDEPFDTPIPEEFVPDTYHTDKLKQFTDELNHLETASRDVLFKKFSEEKQKMMTFYSDKIVKIENLESTYNRLLGEISNWNPPSSEHIPLKAFMVDQINQSKKFDCDTKYYEEKINEYKGTLFDVWLEDRIKVKKDMVEYHKKEIEKEIETFKKRNEWIRALRESLV